jgi:anti-sigma B factor antagonist
MVGCRRIAGYSGLERKAFVKSTQIDDVLIIELPSRLDAVGVAALEEQLATTVTQHAGNVVVDMSPVDFVASLALRMLLTNLRTVQSLGGDLRLAGLQPQIAEIFRKSRFDTLFKIYPDHEAAIAAFHNQ